MGDAGVREKEKKELGKAEKAIISDAHLVPSEGEREGRLSILDCQEV